MWSKLHQTLTLTVQLQENILLFISLSAGALLKISYFAGRLKQTCTARLFNPSSIVLIPMYVLKRDIRDLGEIKQ